MCIGNAWRSDDAAGLEVARLLRGRLPPEARVVEHEGEPTALIDSWEGAEALWLVDAVTSGSAPGTDGTKKYSPPLVFTNAGRGSFTVGGRPWTMNGRRE